MDKFSKNEVFLYLEQHFELDKKTAKEWLLKWIKSYNKGVEE